MSIIANNSLAQAKTVSTPKRLRQSLFAVWGASLLLVTATIVAVQSQRETIKSVGLDSAPSILTAQRIKDSLADMDTNIANEFLAKPGQNQKAVDGYNARREKLSALLVIAAENITYDDEERLPIQTIQSKVGDYIQLIQQARDFHTQGNEIGMLTAYRAATTIMDKTLLPAATTLAEVNYRYLQRSYQNQRTTATAYLAIVAVSGVLLMGLLISLQWFLNQRMRRILNPGLLAASVIAFLFFAYTNRTLNAAADHLAVAKEAAFDSLYALRIARAEAYSANGDESRYLLDKALAREYEQAFFQKATAIAKAPADQTLDSLANAYQATRDQKFQVTGFQGFLADELNNITFPGEREATIETLRSFGVYLMIDQQIRQLERSGRHQAAIALCLGTKAGQSNWAFDQYRDAHQKVMNINMAGFQAEVVQAFQAVGVNTDFKIRVNPDPQDAQTKANNEAIQILSPTNRVETRAVTQFEVVAVSALAAIGLLTFLGLSPRLKEYSR